MSNPTAAEILQAARDLIETPERWTRGALARNADGVAVRPEDPRAVCWCSVGALSKVSDASFEGVYGARAALEDAAGCDLITWQDTHGRPHAEVLAAFDRAIAAARGDAS